MGGENKKRKGENRGNGTERDCRKESVDEGRGEKRGPPTFQKRLSTNRTKIKRNHDVLERAEFGRGQTRC